MIIRIEWQPQIYLKRLYAYICIYIYIILLVFLVIFQRWRQHRLARNIAFRLSSVIFSASHSFHIFLPISSLSNISLYLCFPRESTPWKGKKEKETKVIGISSFIEFNNRTPAVANRREENGRCLNGQYALCHEKCENKYREIRRVQIFVVVSSLALSNTRYSASFVAPFCLFAKSIETKGKWIESIVEKLQSCALDLFIENESVRAHTHTRANETN